jgi:hypothetical protein
VERKQSKISFIFLITKFPNPCWAGVALLSVALIFIVTVDATFRSRGCAMKTSPEVALTEKNCLKISPDSSTGFPSLSTAVMGSTISNVRPEKDVIHSIRKLAKNKTKLFDSGQRWVILCCIFNVMHKLNNYLSAVGWNTPLLNC